MFRKAPLTVMALAVVIVEILLFMFYVPSGGDLISPKGDESLGQATVILFFLCAAFDVLRYSRRKSAKRSSDAT
jgi:hypothetical protein